MTARFWFLVAGLLWLTGGLSAQLRVVYPNIAERSGSGYGYRILVLALQKSGAKFTVDMAPVETTMERAKAQLDAGEVSVLDVGTSPEFERRWDAVYFPIDRGLSGYRLFLIPRSLAVAFAAVKTLPDLRRFTAGQGLGWADVGILRDSGIQVQEVPVFQYLFRMVNARRFDFFPLGIEEIQGFQERFADDLRDSEIQPTLALHYPFGRLFFVRKGDRALADALLRGLMTAFADGSFQKVFLEDPEVQRSLRLGDLGRRTVIEISNPSMTDEFRKIPQRYFYSPLAN